MNCHVAEIETILPDFGLICEEGKVEIIRIGSACILERNTSIDMEHESKYNQKIIARRWGSALRIKAIYLSTFIHHDSPFTA